MVVCGGQLTLPSFYGVVVSCIFIYMTDFCRARDGYEFSPDESSPQARSSGRKKSIKDYMSFVKGKRQSTYNANISNGSTHLVCALPSPGSSG